MRTKALMSSPAIFIHLIFAKVFGRCVVSFDTIYHYIHSFTIAKIQMTSCCVQLW